MGAAPSLVLALGLVLAAPAVSQEAQDWITGLPRQAVHVSSWPQREEGCGLRPVC